MRLGAQMIWRRRMRGLGLGNAVCICPWDVLSGSGNVKAYRAPGTARIIRWCAWDFGDPECARGVSVYGLRESGSASGGG